MILSGHLNYYNTVLVKKKDFILKNICVIYLTYVDKE